MIGELGLFLPEDYDGCTQRWALSLLSGITERSGRRWDASQWWSVSMNKKDIKRVMRELGHDKRGIGLGEIPNVAITLLVVVVVFVVGYLILAGLSSSTTNASATQAIGNFTKTYDNIVSFSPIWGTVLGAVVLLGIVIGALTFGRSGLGGGGV